MYDAEVVILLPNQALQVWNFLNCFLNNIWPPWMLSSCPNLNKRIEKSYVTQIQLKLEKKKMRTLILRKLDFYLERNPTNVVHTSTMYLSY